MVETDIKEAIRAKKDAIKALL